MKIIQGKRKRNKESISAVFMIQVEGIVSLRTIDLLTNNIKRKRKRMVFTLVLISPNLFLLTNTTGGKY